MSQSFRPNNRQDLYPHQEISRVVLSPWALVRDSLLYIVRLSQSSNVPLTLHSLKMPVKHSQCHESNVKANGCTEMLQNVCTCLHHEKCFGLLQKRHFQRGTSVFFTIFAARFTSKKHLGAASNRQLMDLNLLQGHAYKLTLSWLVIYNHFMTSTAWTLPVLTYSVLGEVPPAVQRRVVPARLPWSKSPHRKLSASAWASNKVGCSNRKKTLHSSRSFHLVATNI